MIAGFARGLEILGFVFDDWLRNLGDSTGLADRGNELAGLLVGLIS